MTTTVFDVDKTIGRPEISKAVARGDLSSVRRIVEAAAAASSSSSSEEEAAGGGEMARTINVAARWKEERYDDGGDVARGASPPPSPGEDRPNDGHRRGDRSSAAEWFDVTPVTLAAMRGHDDVVEYLLRAGADPTLSGSPMDDVAPWMASGGMDGGGVRVPLGDRPDLQMDAFDAAGRLSRKIRRCRRTRDLLMAVRPFWKKAPYSGSSAAKHKRANFTNAPLNIDWVIEAIGEVPKLADVSIDGCVSLIEFGLFWRMMMLIRSFTPPPG
jgi:hypothetical protein